MFLIRKYVLIMEKISITMGKAFSFLIVFILVLQAGESVLRYGFNSPTVWSWELATLIYGAHFVMGAAWVMTYDGHVRTDMLFIHLPRRIQSLVELILFPMLFLPFIGVMIWKCTANAIYSVSIMETTYTQWGPPFYPLKVLIAFSFVLLLLQGIAKWLRCFVFFTKGEEIAP